MSGGSSASGPGRASISTEKLVPRDNWQDVLKKAHALPAVSGGGSKNGRTKNING
jgi:hypothetical protein